MVTKNQMEPNFFGVPREFKLAAVEVVDLLDELFDLFCRNKDQRLCGNEGRRMYVVSEVKYSQPGEWRQDKASLGLSECIRK